MSCGSGRGQGDGYSSPPPSPSPRTAPRLASPPLRGGHSAPFSRAAGKSPLWPFAQRPRPARAAPLPPGTVWTEGWGVAAAARLPGGRSGSGLSQAPVPGPSGVSVPHRCRAGVQAGVTAGAAGKAQPSGPRPGPSGLLLPRALRHRALGPGSGKPGLAFAARLSPVPAFGEGELALLSLLLLSRAFVFETKTVDAFCLVWKEAGIWPSIIRVNYRTTCGYVRVNGAK